MAVMHSASSSRVVLVNDRTAHPGAPKLRRYKIARLRLNDPPPTNAPFAHLKRAYD